MFLLFLYVFLFILFFTKQISMVYYLRHPSPTVNKTGSIENLKNSQYVLLFIVNKKNVIIKPLIFV